MSIFFLSLFRMGFFVTNILQLPKEDPKIYDSRDSILIHNF